MSLGTSVERLRPGGKGEGVSESFARKLDWLQPRADGLWRRHLSRLSLLYITQLTLTPHYDR